MGIISSLMNSKPQKSEEGFIDMIIGLKGQQLSVKNKAIGHAIDMIASTISKCELKVYEYKNNIKKIEIAKNEVYYKLNIKPNDNEHGTEFFYRVIYSLLENEEILLVELNNKLYLSINWITSRNICSEKIYSHVQVIDEEDNILVLNKTFKASEVIHIVLKNRKIKKLMDSFYSDYGKLVDASFNQYINKNSLKYRIKYPGNQLTLKDPKTNKDISYEEYKNKLVDGLFDSEDKAILLSEQFDLIDLNANANVPIDKYHAVIKKWSDEVASTYNIPLDLFYGNKTDKSTSTTDFITFCIIPVMQLIEDALNAALIKKEDFKMGSCIRYNRWNIKHMDILEASSGIDKLFSDGFSHNEICDFLSIPGLNEEWADKHYITKNYAEAGSLELKGGEENE